MESEEEHARFIDRRVHFRGTARIHLDALRFDNKPGSHFIDPKNITRLVQIFELEGCLRLDLEHHVPAIISQDVFERSLRISKITGGDLLEGQNPPELRLPSYSSIRCLHGIHRIEAAHKFLLAGDRWWTVDLYSDGLTQSSRRDLRDDYSNSRNFCDGDIYRQIRRCQEKRDGTGESRWFARLSQCKRKDLRQLQRRKQMKHLAAALDDLLPFPGFWPSLQLGTLHRVLNLKCPQELRHYLVHINSFWNTIIGGDLTLRSLIDFGTIQSLQMRNPWASRTDRDFIDQAMEAGTIFPLITAQPVRYRILESLQRMNCMIPSLFTFFEDTKWLEPCAQIMRKLLPSGCRKPIKETLYSNYESPRSQYGALRIEMRGHKYHSKPQSSERELVECGYRQLWLFAWRHFPELSTLLPRRDLGKPKPPARESNEQCWSKLAKKAQDSGFRTDSITKLLSQEPDEAMAKAFLNRVRPQEFHSLAPIERKSIIDGICKLLKDVEDNEILEGPDVPEADPEVSLLNRCGRPHERAFEAAKSQFFLFDVYASKERHVSAFSVNRDIFQAFFGIESPFQLEDEDTVDSTMPNAPENLQLSPFTQGAPGGGSESSERQRPSGSRRRSRSPQDRESGRQHHRRNGRSRSPEIGSSTGRRRTRSNEVVNRNPGDENSRSDIVLLEGDQNGTPNLMASQELTMVRQGDEAQTQMSLQDYTLFDLESSELFDFWDTCQEGDVLFVSSTDLNWKVVRKGEDYDISELAEHSFSVATDRAGGGCIELQAYRTYSKGPKYDGVIYIHPKKYKSESIRLDGKTTKARLHHLEQKVKRKRKNNPPPSPVPKKMRDKPMYLMPS